MVEWDNCPSGSIPARLRNIAGSIPALRSILGCRQAVRRETLTLVFRRFESCHPSHSLEKVCSFLVLLDCFSACSFCSVWPFAVIGAQKTAFILGVSSTGGAPDSDSGS